VTPLFVIATKHSSNHDTALSRGLYRLDLGDEWLSPRPYNQDVSGAYIALLEFDELQAGTKFKILLTSTSAAVRGTSFLSPWRLI
jgi:hypothetical protein